MMHRNGERDLGMQEWQWTHGHNGDTAMVAMDRKARKGLVVKVKVALVKM
jgi:hypothetical protein